MFRDANDEFMMSFGAVQDDYESGECFSPTPHSHYSEAKISTFKHARGFNMVQQQSEQKSVNSDSVKKAGNPVKAKRINWIRESMVSSRKFSDSNLGASIRISHNQQNFKKIEKRNSQNDSQCINSEIINDQEPQVPQEVPEVHPPEQDPETYYMKKVRLLQTKFKQINLFYENQALQLKKNCKGLENDIALYKETIMKYQPTLQEQIDKAIAERDGNMSFISSSSSNSSDSRSENIAMPVMSQIMEVKIQGKKLCDSVKDLSNRIKQLEKQNQQLQLEQLNLGVPSFFDRGEKVTAEPINLTGNSNPDRKLRMSRKYSIPALYPTRNKKLSFQTTIISQKQRPSFSKFHESVAPSCNLCEKLKSHLLKFNSKLRQVSQQNGLL